MIRAEDPLYRDYLLDHSQHPHNYGQLKVPDIVASKSNVTCGDAIQIFGQVNKNRILLLQFTGQGCVLSIASASILTDCFANQLIADILRMTPEDYLNELQLVTTPARLSCALLGFQTIREALHTWQNQQH